MGIVIAIDGPAAAGKGTLARRIAAAYGLSYLDTGLLYRATARRVLDAGGAPHDEMAALQAARTLDPRDFLRGDLRTADIDRAASQIAAIAAVRAALLDFQRQFATRHGAVLDGRDIGTVVFPGADAKIFVTANLAARARRRWAERPGADLAQIEQEMAARDQADAARATAPLEAAVDAVILDTTDLDADAAFAAACDILTHKGIVPVG